jgi:membrane-associated phospholipid phosphatase
VARHVAYFLVRAAAITALFCVVYGAADAITGLRATRVRVHMDWELAVPFVPWTTAIYSSVYAMFPFTPFVLRRREEIDAFARAIAIEIVAAGLVFLAVPAEPAFPAVARDLGGWAVAFEAADAINLRYNMVPSLHVALAASCAAAFAPRVRRVWRATLWLWTAAVCVATITTHQHHVIDVVAGVVLAYAAVRATDRRPSPEVEAADAEARAA